MTLNTTIQKGTEEAGTTNSKEIRGINRTLYQVGWPMVKDNNSSSYGDNKGADEVWFILCVYYI